MSSPAVTVGAALAACVSLSICAAVVYGMTSGRETKLDSPLIYSPGDKSHPVAECRVNKEIYFDEKNAAAEADARARVREFTRRCAAARPGGVHACMVANPDDAFEKCRLGA